VLEKSRGVTVIGLGYVGLPLAIAAAGCGYRVTGIEVDESRLKALNAGTSPVDDVSRDDIREVVESGLLRFTSDFSSVSESDFVIACVPTPINEEAQPELGALLSTVERVSQFIQKGAVFITESTSFPGTLREIVEPFFSSNGIEGVHLVVAPERIDPGNRLWTMRTTPRLIGSLTELGGQLAFEFYSNFCEKVIRVKTPEIAELAKLLENSYRQVNIALVNEIGNVARRMGIDFHEVINAAATKPYGFQSFSPGIGVGGHCIPVDPMYLSWKAQRIGLETSLIDQAQEINISQPSHASRCIIEEFPDSGTRVCILGISYKSGTRDTRESPAIALMEILRSHYEEVSWIDPVVLFRDGEESRKDLTDIDLVVVVHPYVDVIKSAEEKGISLFDCSGKIYGLPQNRRLF